MDRRIKIGVDVDGGDDSSKSASERIYEGVVAFKNDYPEVDVVLCGTQDNIKKFDESLGCFNLMI